MNFELTPQQKAVQQSARQFAQTVLQETVLEDDAAGRFPEEAYKKMGEMGFVGLPFPKEYGGQGGDYLSYVLALEEISKINSSVGIAYSVCTSLYSGALINDGNEEQKKKYLPEVLSGKKMGSFCLTEPEWIKMLHYKWTISRLLYGSCSYESRIKDKRINSIHRRT